jgi:hypothetical protein
MLRKIGEFDATGKRVKRPKVAVSLLPKPYEPEQPALFEPVKPEPKPESSRWRK